jgi:hypothetical protein
MVQILELLHALWSLRHIWVLIAFIKAYPLMSAILGILVLSGVAVAVLMRRAKHQDPLSIR